MRPSLDFAAICVAIVVVSGACPNVVGTGTKSLDVGCTSDAECLSGDACVNGTCTAPIGIGDEGEGSSATGEGEGSIGGEGEGEGASSSGEGEGEGSTSSGEGEGEGSAGPTSGSLFVTAGPELVNALPGCQCEVSNTPASNVDLKIVDAAGNACAHPSDPSCGIDGGKCACALSNAQWFASRQEEPRGNQNDVWIVDEGVVQPNGPDGALTIKASVADDCLLAPASTTASTNEACFQLDCDGDFGAVSCFDYTQLGGTCGTAASNAASEATSQDCMVRGTVPVRVHVEATGAFARDFCVHLDAGESVDAVVVRRTGGVLAVTSVNPSVTEVAVGAPCP